MSSASNSRFNAEAAAWDSNPNLHKASALALQSILSHIPQLTSQPSTIDVLEIGCGTGLLSFLLAPLVRSLTAVDTASGMIDALTQKLGAQDQVTNIVPVCAELNDPDDQRIGIDPITRQLVKGRRFDLIVSHLVLHHIPSLEAIFATMAGCLKPGGSVALTDFEDFGPEARRFHAEARMDGVERHGIPRDGVKKLLEGAGLIEVRVETAFEIEKGVEKTPGASVVKGEGGEKMVFPFLICVGRKTR
jgi:SAM-dependent methyltransferase